MHIGIPELWTQVLDAWLWTLDSGRWTVNLDIQTGEGFWILKFFIDENF